MMITYSCTNQSVLKPLFMQCLNTTTLQLNISLSANFIKIVCTAASKTTVLYILFFQINSEKVEYLAKNKRIFWDFHGKYLVVETKQRHGSIEELGQSIVRWLLTSIIFRRMSFAMAVHITTSAVCTVGLYLSNPGRR